MQRLSVHNTFSHSITIVRSNEDHSINFILFARRLIFIQSHKEGRTQDKERERETVFCITRRENEWGTERHV